jgi:hypothetical protein
VFWPIQLHGLVGTPTLWLVFCIKLSLIAPWQQKLSHSMASTTTPSNNLSVPPSGPGTSGTGSSGGGVNLPPVSATCIKSAANGNITMPPGTSLEALTGQNWNVWSGTIMAILQLNEVDAILTYDTLPSGVDQEDWNSVQKRTMAYLCLYCALDVFSTVASDTDFPTFKHKFDRLRITYGGVGSTAIFDLWIELTQA